MARGIFVRMPFSPPQDRCIRVTAGLPADLDAFAAALPQALAAAADGSLPCARELAARLRSIAFSWLQGK